MRKYLSIFMAFILAFAINSFYFAQEANADTLTLPNDQYQVTVDGVTYDVSTIIAGDFKTSTVTDGNTTDTVIHNSVTGVTYVNGEKVSNEFVNFIESVVETDDEESVSVEVKDDMLETFSNDQGGGVGVSWIYEYTNPGSFNLTSMTASIVIGVLAAVFTKNILVGILATIASSLIATMTTNEKKTIYYIEVRYWQPDYNWPLLYKDYKSDVTFYEYSTYKGYITSATIYH